MVPPQGAWITGNLIPGGVRFPPPQYDLVITVDAQFPPLVIQTTISMQSNPTHHSPTAFPDADKFDPSRWLTPSGSTTKMKEAYMPFSKGSRMCMGVHPARMELKLIIAALIHGWDISLGERTTDDTMSMTDQFVLMLKGRFCDLVFKKVRD